jgi:hypothetical protein
LSLEEIPDLGIKLAVSEDSHFGNCACLASLGSDSRGGCPYVG